MFNKAIIGTALASEVADRLFSNITAINAPDQSFLSTLRILLRGRLPQDESAQLTCVALRYSEQEISCATTADCMNWFLPSAAHYPPSSRHSISIVHTTQPNAGTKMLEIIKSNTGKGKRYLGNYTCREDLKAFYARKAKALFYTDDAGRNTIIFTDKLEMKQFHALQITIPRYLSALFRDHPLTEKETELLKSAGNKSAVEFETLIESFVKELDFRAEIIRSKLAGFETVFERMRADELRDEINSYQDSYEHHLSAMRDMISKIQERKYTLAGLECAIGKQAEDSELMEYFMCNKSLSIIKASGTAIEFIVHGYADIYDEDAFEQYVRNHDGYMYDHLHPSVTKPQMEKLYRAIFGEDTYKLRLCAAYTADMRTGLGAIKNYIFPPESQTYLHNPHIQHMGCIGSYAGRFQEYMHRRDYVGAIDQAVVSARNLNFYDSPVISKFAKELSRTAISCIERTDGTLLTPREAIIELEGDGASCQNPSF